jgi:hypothetical protein
VYSNDLRFRIPDFEFLKVPEPAEGIVYFLLLIVDCSFVTSLIDLAYSLQLTAYSLQLTAYSLQLTAYSHQPSDIKPQPCASRTLASILKRRAHETDYYPLRFDFDDANWVCTSE